MKLKLILMILMNYTTLMKLKLILMILMNYTIINEIKIDFNDFNELHYN
jgi:hypothetical protein